MAYPKVASLSEQRMAKRFLRALGLSERRVSDPSNIIAIVAWFRVVSPTGRVRGNNPFGIRLGGAWHFNMLKSRGFISKWSYYKKGGAYYLKFPSFEKGLLAAAYLLRTERHDASLVRALRQLHRGQGSNFLVYLAMSAWSLNHYGVPPGGNVLDPALNDLLRAQRNIRGFAQLVKKLVKRVTRTQRTSRTVQPPPSPGPPPAPTPYIDPYAVQRFYMQRHGANQVPS